MITYICYEPKWNTWIFCLWDFIGSLEVLTPLFPRWATLRGQSRAVMGTQGVGCKGGKQGLGTPPAFPVHDGPKPFSPATWEQRGRELSPSRAWGCPICSWKEKSILEPILTWPQAATLRSEVLPNTWGQPGELDTVPPSLLTSHHQLIFITYHLFTEIHQSRAYLDLATLAALRKNSPSLPAPQVVPFCLTSQGWRRRILVLVVLPP